MIVYTDDIQYAEYVLGESLSFQRVEIGSEPVVYHRLLGKLFESKTFFRVEYGLSTFWKYLFIVKVASCSHYDLVSEFCRENVPIPDGSLFLADSGGGFHGFKGRPWAGLAGNIHLVAYFEPNRVIEQIAVSLTVLATVSVVETIDTIESLAGRAEIKWINDVLIDNSKVAGVLAFTQAEGDIITAAAVGIGLNVEKTPHIPVSDFVPRAGSVWQFEPNPGKARFNYIFANLILALERNIENLLFGKYCRLIDQYRRRSAIIGKKVVIRPDTDDAEDDEICSGRVLAIGDDLYLHLEGVSRPVSTGRLVLIS
ncbi:MAG: hypothetical protein CVT49_01730 [candidate division Zixibacteria bacterium HGW-Zixibacteria-1]|nr:MAG: hypothetical protein CVT49_01730 [candidate division Zixibacteria bacterium HGW-Zixibacteria-1]